MKQRLVVFPRFGTATAVNVASNDKPAALASTASPLRLATAAAAEPHIHHLRDGEVVLYRRPRSRIWQCRYKQEQGGWARITTGKTSLDMATRVACEQYDEARFRQKMGLAPQQRTFASIAQATVAELQRDIAAGKAAGMPTIAVRFGYLNGSNPDDWGATAVVDTPAEILQHIHQDR